jgi:hypothetical protein
VTLEQPNVSRANGHLKAMGARPLPRNLFESAIELADAYLAFEWLLPKVDVFVTNAGYGGVNQAMSFSVPLVTAVGRTATCCTATRRATRRQPILFAIHRHQFSQTGLTRPARTAPDLQRSASRAG